jgi:hypothetical protein
MICSQQNSTRQVDQPRLIAVTQARDYARAGGDKQLIRRVAEVLQQRWDPAAEFAAPDGERSSTSHAKTILGILSTGADNARVKGYLRRAEEEALGAARTTSMERGQLAEDIWHLMLDVAAASSQPGRKDAAT